MGYVFARKALLFPANANIEGHIFAHLPGIVDIGVSIGAFGVCNTTVEAPANLLEDNLLRCRITRDTHVRAQGARGSSCQLRHVAGKGEGELRIRLQARKRNTIHRRGVIAWITGSRIRGNTSARSGTGVVYWRVILRPRPILMVEVVRKLHGTSDADGLATSKVDGFGDITVDAFGIGVVRLNRVKFARSDELANLTVQVRNLRVVLDAINTRELRGFGKGVPSPGEGAIDQQGTAKRAVVASRPVPSPIIETRITRGVELVHRTERRIVGVRGVARYGGFNRV